MVGLVGSVKKDLRDAIKGERHNIRMYSSYARQATKDRDKVTAAVFRDIASDEVSHLKHFKAALRHVK
ncbi:ferritin family protein [Nigerium massiliense]|uniref:ferritin family protein n=1 Tax=Nigerium massiliense TaxID=1522317 RepID=UPI0009E2B4D1|nr:ferritin family protein [Nigerium massiliense]